MIRNRRTLTYSDEFSTLVKIIGAATIGNSTEVPQKVKNRTTIKSSIPLLGIHSKNTKTVT